MKQKKTLLTILYTLALVAILWYPVSKIIKFETSPDYEEFKFNATVYDPYDPMRGRYVQLEVLPNKWKEDDPQPFTFGYKAKGYAVIKKDGNGFAQLVRLEKDRTQLQKGENFVKINKIYRDFSIKNDSRNYKFTWPFNRFYLNELKAPELEKELQKSNTPMILKIKIFRDGSFAIISLEKNSANGK